MSQDRFGVGHFKTHCLSILAELHEKHRSIVITKRGKPIAKVIPWEEAHIHNTHPLHGSVSREKDIISPVGERWEAA